MGFFKMSLSGVCLGDYPKKFGSNAFSRVDAIVTPISPTTAFKLGEKISDPLEMYLTDILTISANLAAIPGISVPIDIDSSGMPIGLQIMGNHFQERTILNIAKAIETSCDKIIPDIK